MKDLMTDYQESKYMELTSFGWEYGGMENRCVIMQQYEYINNSKMKTGEAVRIDSQGKTEEIAPC